LQLPATEQLKKIHFLTTLFKKYEILKLEDLFTIQTNSFMYKFINSKCPSSFNNFFVPFKGENRSKSFIIDILKSQNLEHFPSFFMPKVRNNLCIEMKRQTSLAWTTKPLV